MVEEKTMTYVRYRKDNRIPSWVLLLIIVGLAVLTVLVWRATTRLRTYLDQLEAWR